MTDAEAFAILEDAHRRCADEDMRTPAVYAALLQLEPRASELWPFDQFRRALGSLDTAFAVDGAGRGQLVNASLNGIRLALRADV